MNAEDIARYLRTHPQFFDHHPDLLDEHQRAASVRRPAIPLAERQTVALREKLKRSRRLAELLQFGEENDAISEKVHRLSVALAGAKDFPALATSIYFHLREDFAVPHVRCASGKERAGGFRRGAANGRDAAPTPMRWARRSAARRSQSVPALVRRGGRACALHGLVPLGQTSVFGLLALGSEDAKRFFPEMGTLYLRRIGELCAAGVTARL